MQLTAVQAREFPDAQELGQTVELLQTGVRVRELDVPSVAVADYLRQASAEEREWRLIEAIEVGAYCLERAMAVRDFDYVRSQVESILATVERQVSAIPQIVESGLTEKLGDKDGQLLAPIRNIVDSTTRTMTERVNGVKDLLVNEIDPARNTSTLGRALGHLKDLLDPTRTDSIQATVTETISGLSREDGALAKSVKATVEDAIRPLADEVNRISRQLAAAEAAQEIIDTTTRKGAPYEGEVVVALHARVHPMGAAVRHTGPDNRPGDIVIDFSTASAAPGLTVVVEARDRTSPAGRKAIGDTLSKAMSARDANVAIYVSRTPEGLAAEIGEWAEGTAERGPWIATTHSHLILAVRFALILHRLDALNKRSTAIDTGAVADQVDRIRTALKRISTIKSKVTAIRESGSAIYEEAETLQADVRSALFAIEEALRHSQLRAVEAT